MYFLAERMVTQDVGSSRRHSRAVPRDASTSSRRLSVSQQDAPINVLVSAQTSSSTPLLERVVERPSNFSSTILRHSLTGTERSSIAGTPTGQILRQRGIVTPMSEQLAGSAPQFKKRNSESVSARAGSIGNIGALVSANRHEGRRLLWNVVRAFLVRALFVVHSLTTIWAAVNVRNDPSLWTFALVSALIPIEGAHTIVTRTGDERKWFSPSVLLYICATAPPLHLLETQICEWRRAEGVARLEEYIHFQLLEQLLLVILIIGRWLLPKGEISREQLSQILLAYLAISSDIVEFFDVFKERIVYEKPFVQRVVLTAWTLSLLQFPFVLTVSRARKMRVAITEEDVDEQQFSQMFHDIDLWAIFLANGLQDIPFFVVRLYLIAYHGLITYTMIFFICKNALIIVLQTYRAFIIINDRYSRKRLAELRRVSKETEESHASHRHPHAHHSLTHHHLRQHPTSASSPSQQQRRRPMAATLVGREGSSSEDERRRSKKRNNSGKKQSTQAQAQLKRHQLLKEEHKNG